jgi:hypothetical protein
MAVLLSFDVVSLFTHVPEEEDLQVIRNKTLRILLPQSAHLCKLKV